MAYDATDGDEAAALLDIIGRVRYLQGVYPDLPEATIAQMAVAVTNQKAAALIIDSIDLLTAAT